MEEIKLLLNHYACSFFNPYVLCLLILNYA
jgi:hypothetical protein